MPSIVTQVFQVTMSAGGFEVQTSPPAVFLVTEDAGTYAVAVTEQVFAVNYADRADVFEVTVEDAVQFNVTLPNPTGRGIPGGGQAGQVLAKSANASYETEWRDETVTSVGGNTGDVVDIAPTYIGQAGATVGQVLGWDGVKWAPIDQTGSGGGIPEAPIDGTQYARQDASWVAVTAGGLSDAPSDGTLYARRDGAWITLDGLYADASHVTETSTHGVSGDIVGTTDAQTLSGKDFSDTLVAEELRSRGDIYINSDGPDGDSFLYFYDTGSANDQFLKWDDADDRFELSESLQIYGTLLAGDTVVSSLEAPVITQGGTLIGDIFAPISHTHTESEITDLDKYTQAQADALFLTDAPSDGNLYGRQDGSWTQGISTTDLDDHVADTSTHGVTGDLVGTTDDQTLSNKDFSDSVQAVDFRSLNDIYLNYGGPDGDAAIYFYDGGGPTTRYLRWSESAGELQTNMPFRGSPTVTASDSVRSEGAVYLGYNDAEGDDSYLYFNDGTANSLRYLFWNGTGFEFNGGDLEVPGLTIGGSDVDTYIGAQADVAANTAARHTHANKAELDLVTDGDHDVRVDNPHGVTVAQIGAADASHTHPLVDLEQSSATTGQAPIWNGSAWVPGDLAYSVTANVIYVDPTNGDDVAGDGTPEKPYATIQKGIDEASAGEVVLCSGSGDFAEDVTCKDDVDLILPYSDLTLDSGDQLTLANNRTVIRRLVRTTGAGAMVVSSNTSGYAILTCFEIRDDGSGSTIEANNSAPLDFSFSQAFIGNGNAFLSDDSSARHVHLRGEDIYLTAPGTTAVLLTGGSTVLMTVHHVKELGLGVGGCTVFDLDDGDVNASFQEIGANVLADIEADGNLNIVAQQVSGTVTNDGVYTYFYNELAGAAYLGTNLGLFVDAAAYRFEGLAGNDGAFLALGSNGLLVPTILDVGAVTWTDDTEAYTDVSTTTEETLYTVTVDQDFTAGSVSFEVFATFPYYRTSTARLYHEGNLLDTQTYTGSGSPLNLVGSVVIDFAVTDGDEFTVTFETDVAPGFEPNRTDITGGELVVTKTGNQATPAWGSITGTISDQTDLYDNFLARNNTDVYVPSADYHPATKKYADDLIAALVPSDLGQDGATSGQILSWNGSAWVPIDAPTADVESVNGQTGVVVLTTTDVAEGTNLYYTEGRVSANVDVAANTAARHTHANKAQLDLVTDGDHDVRTDNPHGVTPAQIGAADASHTHTAADVTDFDTEVGNHPDVAANTSARHSHANKAQLDLVTDGDHDVRVDNPHGVTAAQAGASALGHTHTLTDITDSGTAAALDVPATGDAAAGEVVKGDDSRLTDDRTPTAHASTHERGGTDEIDGDHLDVDFTPANYTPNTTPAEAANVDDLAAHLSGIDVSLGSALTSVDWGDIGGTLASQTDLQAALDAKADTGHSHTASDVTDFDTEVGNQTDVAANTSARHSHANKAQLDLVTDGDHDVRTDNPHGVTAAQAGAADASHTHGYDDISYTGLNDTDDLDNVVTDGLYRWTGLAPANAPDSQLYMQMVVRDDTGQPTQMAWGSSTKGRLYIRRRDSGVWQPWARFMAEGDDVLAANVYVNQDGPDVDGYVYFYDASSPTGQHLKWDNGAAQFNFSTSVDVSGAINASSNIYADGNIIAENGGTNGQAELDANKRGFAFNLLNVPGGWARGFAFYNDTTLYAGLFGYNADNTDVERLVLGDDYNDVSNGGVVVRRDTARVGINTLTPTAAFDVEGASHFNGDMDVTGRIDTTATIASGNNLTAAGNLYLNQAGPDGDASIYFYDGGNTGQHLKWDDAAARFEFSTDLEVGGDITMGGDAVARSADVQDFTANGTWTKPTGAKFVVVHLWGGGGGGGAGAYSGLNTGGGAGGCGGMYVRAEYDAADLSASEGVTVGGGGSGPAGRSTSGFGSAGGDGGDSTFDAHTAKGGDGGGGGRNGTAVGGAEMIAVSARVGPGIGIPGGGGDGGNSSGTTGAGTRHTNAGGGGGGGGGHNGFDTGYSGAQGGAMLTGTSTTGGNTGSGSDAPSLNFAGDGGGGGAGGDTGSGGSGGAGGYPAGGGGGGGATISGGISGGGGDGADGRVVVITYF